ncbi:MAG: alpha/beta hydrolase [Chloroflexi bacterium]|nr:alpha/beta hydrolase [Chloroflexota bacterium]
MTKNHAQNSPVKRLRWFPIAVLVIVIGILFWGLRWATFSRQPLPETVDAFVSDGLVIITHTPWLSFSPTQTNLKTGFIFYPGGRIDPRGYAPLMKTIAAEGYLVVVPEMPINMAAFKPNIADEIIAQYPEINQWVIGGHSIGGTMAAQYTHTHKETVDGLAIWASYPADNVDLSDFNRPISLIYGSNDPRVNERSVSARQHLLSADTHYIQIDGGDHHQFGSYEIKPENHHATISRVSQQEQIIQATLELLDAASNFD